MVGSLTPPYYAVIFTSRRTAGDNGYAAMADLLVALAEEQPGFLGADAARNDVGITVSYWKDMDAIQRWKTQADHAIAQQKGQDIWYKDYSLRIAKVEREIHFPPAD